MMLLEDFMIASSSRESRAWLRSTLEARFKFGKYRDCQAGLVDFAGRRLTLTPRKILIDQEKYILEEVKALSVAKGRMGQKDAPLEHGAFKALRSLV
eukprot:3731354-Pyramimonas_sp.AAC.1